MNTENNNAANAIVWFEIPVLDLERATQFYQTVLQTTLKPEEMGGTKMALFPNHGGENGVGGAIIQSPMHKPSDKGVVVYLNAGPDLQVALSRVEKAGGTVTMPKTLIHETIGYMAFFIDSEGNSIALHSQN